MNATHKANSLTGRRRGGVSGAARENGAYRARIRPYLLGPQEEPLSRIRK